MSYALMSIIALVVSIVIGVKRKINIGIVAMFFAFVLGQFVFGINANQIIIKGWPLGLFFIMMSAMFMFSFATANGATVLVAEKLAYAIRNYSKVLPWAFMVATGFLTVCGADPSVVIFMLPIALIAAEKSRIDPIILCVMTLGGALIGSCGPVSVVGIVTSGLALKAGVSNYYAIWAATATTMVMQAIIVYFAFGGHKAKKGTDLEYAKPAPFNTKQIQTLVIVGIALCLILFLKMAIGGAMFIGAALMMIVGVADEKDALKSVNWGVLLMVGGTGLLVEVMTQVDGIKMVAQFLSSIMNGSTAAPLMALIAGLMTSVSSATGVVMPTLFPTLPNIALELNGVVAPIQLMQAVQSGAIGSVAYSPLSALGAMAMASLPASVDYRKVFTQMMGAAVLSLCLTMLLNFLGIFSFYNNLF